MHYSLVKTVVLCFGIISSLSVSAREAHTLFSDSTQSDVLYAAMNLTASSVSTNPNETPEVFMPGTQDIPLMNNLKIDVSDNMNFDTPAGQLITFEAQSRKYSSLQILDYYHVTLPALGWVETEKNHYQREKDSMILTVIHPRKPAIIRFEITLMNTGE